MKHKHHSCEEDVVTTAFREVLCRVLRCCPPPERVVVPIVTIRFGTLVITFEGDFIMDVKDSDGPFVATVDKFVDAKGNPVQDTDTPVFASSDDTVATVEADPTNPQQATVTLTGALGQAQITATFGDPAAGGFVVTGLLNVLPGAAVSATMEFAGPGAS